jgi:S1-C subfamily serine protease
MSTRLTPPTGPDLLALSRSMVKIRAVVPEDAFTASVLGTQRNGNGIVIGEDGLILTIGYLITEASDVWLTTHNGRELPGHGLAYDQVTGFGLVLPLGPLGVSRLELGHSSALVADTAAYVLSHPQFAPPFSVKVLSRREFAGAWEYLLEDAIFTAPAHSHWSGAALIDQQGLLTGVGSLLVREVVGSKETDANMFVPTDLLKPVLDDLRTRGRAARPPRPWLGVYAAEIKGNVVVAGVVEGGPAQIADVREGDLIREVADREVSTLGEFYRHLWAQGPAGSVITLTTVRSGKPARIKLRSVDRTDLLKRPQAH